MLIWGVLGGVMLSLLLGGIYVVLEKHKSRSQRGSQDGDPARNTAGPDAVVRGNDPTYRLIEQRVGTLEQDFAELRNDVRRRFNRLYARSRSDDESGVLEPDQNNVRTFDKHAARMGLGRLASGRGIPE